MPKLKSALAAHHANAARYAHEQEKKKRAAAQAKASKAKANGGRPHPGKGDGAGGGKKQKLEKPSKSIIGSSESTRLDSIDLGRSALPATTTAGVIDRKTDAAGMHGASNLGRNGSSIDAKPRAAARRPTIPFDKTDTILLLGEANFSFANALLLPPHELSGHMICATSYDSESVCYQKYPDAKDNVDRLRAKGVRVKFGVDAGDLPKDIVGKNKGKGKARDEDQGGRWSRVIFNFPHAGEPYHSLLTARIIFSLSGAGITDQDRNILSNQHLLLRTLRSVHPILTSGPPPKPPTSKRKRKAKGSDDEDDDQDKADLEGVSDLEDDLYANITPVPSSFTPPIRQGTVLITLLDQNPYSLWNLPKLATKPPPTCPGTRLPQPKYTLLRSFEFRPEVYEGYAHRRTIGFKEGVSRDDNKEITGRQGKARTWEFARFP